MSSKHCFKRLPSGNASPYNTGSEMIGEGVDEILLFGQRQSTLGFCHVLNFRAKDFYFFSPREGRLDQVK